MAVGLHVLTRLTHCAEATNINLDLHSVSLLQESTLGSWPLRLPFMAAELLEVLLLGMSASKMWPAGCALHGKCKHFSRISFLIHTYKEAKSCEQFIVLIIKESLPNCLMSCSPYLVDILFRPGIYSSVPVLSL